MGVTGDLERAVSERGSRGNSDSEKLSSRQIEHYRIDKKTRQ